MSEQFFTDDKMFILSVTFFVLMLAIGGVLVKWRDWDVLWVFAVEALQIMPMLYYSHFRDNPGSPFISFPEVNLLMRPFIVSLWLLMLVYSVVRLRAKYGAHQWG